MPELRNDNFICFVQGHGAKYASDCPAAAVGVKQTPAVQAVPVLTLERVRELAAAQLAFQRVALRTLTGK